MTRKDVLQTVRRSGTVVRGLVASLFASVLVLFAASCSSGPGLTFSNDAAGTYAKEIKTQVDIINGGYKKGSLDDKDIDAYLASWDRVIAVFPKAKEIAAGFTDAEKQSYLVSSFQYAWFIGGKFANDGSLADQSGFYGTAVNKKDGRLLPGVAWTPAILFLTTGSPADSDDAAVLNFDSVFLNLIYTDLDKVVKPNQKRDLGMKIMSKFIACWPNHNYSDAKALNKVLVGAAAFGQVSGALVNWLSPL